jgi:hypothetical protein
MAGELLLEELLSDDRLIARETAELYRSVKSCAI